MTAEGVDWVATGPSPAELRAAGKSFALRYIDRADYPSLSAAEAAALHAQGIDVGCIAEWGSQRMLGGSRAGAADGQRAARALRDIGAPAGTAVYFAADWNATSAQMAAIDAYLTAAGSVIGHECTGVYGGLAVIRHALQSRTASRFWQTYAWSGTPTVWAAGTHLQQYRNGQAVAGHTVDLDRALVADWGQWHARVSATTLEMDMTPLAITDEAPGTEVTVAAGTDFYDLDGKTRIDTFDAALDWRASPYGAGALRAIYATTGGLRRIVLLRPSGTRTAADATAAAIAKAIAADRATAKVGIVYPEG